MNEQPEIEATAKQERNLPADLVRFNLVEGATLVSKNGTIREIKEINSDGRYFVTSRLRTGEKAPKEEHLSFDDLNLGIDQVARIAYPDGHIYFADPESELSFLKKFLSEAEKNAAQDGAIMVAFMPGGLEAVKARIIELES
jgi:hypothetical protein